MLASGELFPAHHATQNLGRVSASPDRIGNDARHAGRRELAKKLVVVHADHGDVLGNLEVEVPTDLQELLTAGIVAGENAHRLRQAREPVPDRLALSPPPHPRLFPRRKVEDPRLDDIGTPQYA